MKFCGIANVMVETKQEQLVVFEIGLDKVAGRGETLFYLPKALTPVKLYFYFCFIYL